MEIKKNPNLDLRKKTGLFFNIGLVISLLFVLFAFEHKSSGDGNPIPLDYGNTYFPEEALIPPTDISTPPPPPKPKEIILIEVKNEDHISNEFPEIDNTFKEDDTFLDLPYVEDPSIEIVKDSFTVVEKMPTYPGGLKALYKFVGKKIKYPSKARRMGVEGKVFLNFTIDKDGSITSIKVLRGIGSGCDKEAIRVLSNMPKWNPGKQRGKPAKVSMTLPITFKLS